MNKTIEVNGKSYEVTRDGFGIPYINGMTVEKFMDTLPPQDIEWVARIGLKMVNEEPERFEEIADRLEMPKGTVDKLRKFGKHD